MELVIDGVDQTHLAAYIQDLAWEVLSCSSDPDADRPLDRTDSDERQESPRSGSSGRWNRTKSSSDIQETNQVEGEPADQSLLSENFMEKG